MSKQGPDPKKIEEIIKRAKEYLAMPNPLTVEAAFVKATSDFLLDNKSAWGEYKKRAKGTYLNREKKEKDKVVVDFKHEELLRGTQEAAWARRDKEVLDAEATEEELLELRSNNLSFKR